MIDDVVKRLRDRAEGRRKSGKLLQIDDKMFDLLADRIEAAHKREVAVAKMETTTSTSKDSLQVGNMAAMRDALLMVKKLFDGRIMFQPAIREAHNVVRVALAKPPRNCDRFGGDIDKLREACLRERGLNPGEDFPDVFPDWLLAPSTEKKGGASEQ